MKKPLTIAINGFGRIGRMTLRALSELPHPNLKIVAINDLGSVESNLHLLRYDSIHGRFKGHIQHTGDSLDIGFGPIKMLSEPDPAKLPWSEVGSEFGSDCGVDLVFECSGHFTKRVDANKHLQAGAKRVLISAPSEDADITVVYGVNHQQLTGDCKIISNASCTTNCLAPVAKVIQQTVGIDCGYMTTIHSYTGDQRLIDTLHPDLRRARAACLSMIPSSTGAAKAVGLVLPELKGKLDGTSIRVPTANVSVVDFKFTTLRPTTVTEINNALASAAAGEMSGVLAVVAAPLVSADFNHDPHSASVDLGQTQVIQGKFGRVLAWYDNEWGFSNRLLNIASCIADLDCKFN